MQKFLSFIKKRFIIIFSILVLLFILSCFILSRDGQWGYYLFVSLNGIVLFTIVAIYCLVPIVKNDSNVFKARSHYLASSIILLIQEIIFYLSFSSIQYYANLNNIDYSYEYGGKIINIIKLLLMIISSIMIIISIVLIYKNKINSSLGKISLFYTPMFKTIFSLGLFIPDIMSILDNQNDVAISIVVKFATIIFDLVLLFIYYLSFKILSQNISYDDIVKKNNQLIELEKESNQKYNVLLRTILIILISLTSIMAFTHSYYYYSIYSIYWKSMVFYESSLNILSFMLTDIIFYSVSVIPGLLLVILKNKKRTIFKIIIYLQIAFAIFQLFLAFNNYRTYKINYYNDHSDNEFKMMNKFLLTMIKYFIYLALLVATLIFNNNKKISKFTIIPFGLIAVTAFIFTVINMMGKTISFNSSYTNSSYLDVLNNFDRIRQISLTFFTVIIIVIIGFYSTDSIKLIVKDKNGE